MIYFDWQFWIILVLISVLCYLISRHHNPAPKTKAPIVTARVVCAANRYRDGTIVLGVRHFDQHMQAVLVHARIPLYDLATKWDLKAAEEEASGNGSEYSRELLAAGVYEECARDLREALAERLKEMRNPEQGFIDNHGNFLTRKEAWVIAETAGQIIRRGGGDGPENHGLFSENLY